MNSWLVASIHLLTLGIGFGSLIFRANGLSNLKDQKDLRSIFLADNLYGLAAFLWISTGLLRAFAGLEKGTEYYLGSTLFLAKMGLFALVFFLELTPIIVLMRWRKKQKSGVEIDISKAGNLSILSYVELVILIIIVFLASAMARNLYY